MALSSYRPWLLGLCWCCAILALVHVGVAERREEHDPAGPVVRIDRLPRLAVVATTTGTTAEIPPHARLVFVSSMCATCRSGISEIRSIHGRLAA
jgi:hypothetical protein